MLPVAKGEGLAGDALPIREEIQPVIAQVDRPVATIQQDTITGFSGIHLEPEADAKGRAVHAGHAGGELLVDAIEEEAIVRERRLRCAINAGQGAAIAATGGDQAIAGRVGKAGGAGQFFKGQYQRRLGRCHRTSQRIGINNPRRELRPLARLLG